MEVKYSHQHFGYIVWVTPAWQWGRRPSWRHLNLCLRHHPASTHTNMFLRTQQSMKCNCFILDKLIFFLHRLEKSNQQKWYTHTHWTTEHISIFRKHAIRLLGVENQKLDSVTYEVPLHCHQTVGHGKHLGNISCQPLRGEERRGEERQL